MQKDTFYTLSYRGHFIHACHNRITRRDEVSVQGLPFVSVLAAKRWVNRKIKAIANRQLPRV